MFKDLIKNNIFLLNIAAIIHNVLHFNNYWVFRYKNHFSWKGAFFKCNSFKVNGRKNKIHVGSKSRISNCVFTIIGNNCEIIIGGGNTIISNVHFWCQDDGSCIVIGNNFTMESGHIASTEGKSIIIGNDCMFSNDVEIRNGDSHAIIDIETNQRTNFANSVTIGDHVWLGAHVRILKGVSIAKNCIVGNSSLVSKDLKYQNSAYAGVPCKIVKENIKWDRNR